MDQTVYRKKQANRLLYDCALLDILKKYGPPMSSAAIGWI